MTGEKILTVPNVTAGFAFVWGAFIANPYVDSFAKNPTLYAPMQGIASEAYWGLLFVGVGVAAWLLAWTGRTGLEALALAAAFSLFATMYFAADMGSSAWAVYGWLVVCNLAYYQGDKWNKSRKR